MLKSPETSGKHLAGFVSAFLKLSIIPSTTPARFFPDLSGQATPLRYVQNDILEVLVENGPPVILSIAAFPDPSGKDLASHTNPFLKILSSTFHLQPETLH